MITMMTLPALIASAVVAANAKKLNAEWRRKRAARTPLRADRG